MGFFINYKEYIDKKISTVSGGAAGLEKVSLISDLPLTAAEGDLIVVFEDDQIYVFDAQTNSWKATGQSGSGTEEHTHAEFTTLQAQIDALGNGMTFKAEVATFADIDVQYPSKAKGDTFVVSADETHSNDRSLYTYNGSTLIYLFFALIVFLFI